MVTTEDNTVACSQNWGEPYGQTAALKTPCFSKAVGVGVVIWQRSKAEQNFQDTCYLGQGKPVLQ